MAENEEIKKEDAVTEAEAAENTEKTTEKTEPVKIAVEEKKPEKKSSGSKNPFKNRKFKYGTLSVVFTVIFIVAVVLINVIVELVLDRFKIEVDLTKNQIFTLSDETEKYIKGLGSDINIFVTAEEDTLKSSGQQLYEQTVEFLDKMDKMSDKIHVRYVNLLTDPDFSNDYVEDLSSNQMIIKSGSTNRYKILGIGDFMQFKLSDGSTYSYQEANMRVMYSQYSQSPLTVVDYYSTAEEQMVSAMMSVSMEDPTVVTFLTGYGESDSSQLQTILTDNAYVVKSQDIEQVNAVPEDTDILVIYAPTKDYSQDSITKVDEWLSNNGRYGRNLVYIATADAVETPNLDEFLGEWGLEIGKGYIMQLDQNYAYNTGYGMPVLHTLTLNEDTNYYKSMKISSSSRFMGYFTRPVIKLWDEKGNFVNTAIASANGEKCILYPFTADENWTFTEDDYSGYDVIVESAKSQYIDNVPVYSKIIAVGSDLLFVKDFTSASNYSNGEAALALFDANSDNKTESIKIVEKSFKAETYQLDSSQQTMIGLTFAVFIPVVIIIAGIIVWARRRRL